MVVRAVDVLCPLRSVVSLDITSSCIHHLLGSLELSSLESHHSNIPSQNAANYVSETVQGTGAEASKETNKTVAKDGNADVSTRFTAAKDAVIDKKDESSHNAKADLHKGMFTSLPSTRTISY